MKNIVLMTTKYNENKEDAWLTNELAYSLCEDNYNMTVVVFSWLPHEAESSVNVIDGVRVIRIKVPQWVYSKGVINTALKIFIFPLIARKHILKHIKKCDLLIANTPCVTILGLSQLFKRKFKAKTYLVLWDFFPFYLKDLGLMKNRINFKVFHFLEEWMYRSFDKIGCMTKKNVDFLLDNFKSITKEKTQILPLWAKIKNKPEIDAIELRKEFGLPLDHILVIYGGALSVVQDLDNYLNLAKKSLEDNISFLIVGRGTERERLEARANEEGIKNVIFFDYIPRDKYEDLVACCDIGFISLSRSLTVPSFPSKSLDYFKVCMPILASLDPVTDFGDILESKIKAGYAVVAGDLDNLKEKLDLLAGNEMLRIEMGESGRKFYQEQLSVESAKNIILGNFE